MHTPKLLRQWRLGTSLGLLLLASTTIAVFLVGMVLIIFRVPQIAYDSVEAAQHRANRLQIVLDARLASLEERLRPLQRLAATAATAAQLQSALNMIGADRSAMSSLYLLDATGNIEFAAASMETPTIRRESKIDIARTFPELRTAAAPPTAPQWVDTYPSIATGQTVVAVALAAGHRTLIAEVSPQKIGAELDALVEKKKTFYWLIDRRGKLVNGSRPEHATPPAAWQSTPWAQHPALAGAWTNAPLARKVRIDDADLYPAYAKSARLGWIAVVALPAGWANESIRSMLNLLLGIALGSMLVGFLIAPLWAKSMIRPVQLLLQRSRQLTEGKSSDAPLPKSSIVEFERLAYDLESSAAMLHNLKAELAHSEARLDAIVNNTPDFGVQIYNADGTLDFWNPVSERLLGYTAAEVLGRLPEEIGFITPAAAQKYRRACSTIAQSGCAVNHGAIEVVDKQGRVLTVLAATLAIPDINGILQFFCMNIDITQRRAAEREIQELNRALEMRVLARTEELERSNQELAASLSNLLNAQEHLVQSRKLAALGDLVAGIAHEINTPIGNGLMAVSALREHVNEFKKNSAGGLRRSEFNAFMNNTDAATDIALRNLMRSAELIASFKQLAVDQSSSQRRDFMLDRLVHEVLTILTPTLKRTPYKIETEIPDSIKMDSLPGPLGQVIANLINNSIIHGFDGRDHGVIRIRAHSSDNGQVSIAISDDGKGIAEEHIPRIYDAFFTTKFGQGGSGLGLHIVHSTVTQALQGTIAIRSELGVGTEFDITLPTRLSVEPRGA